MLKRPGPVRNQGEADQEFHQRADPSHDCGRGDLQSGQVAFEARDVQELGPGTGEKQPAQEYAADQQEQIGCTGRNAVGARQQRMGRFA